MIKKLLLTLVTLVGLGTSMSYGNGLITTNLTTGTNTITTAPQRVYSVSIASATANLLNLYDVDSTTLTYTNLAYTSVSNVPGFSITNLQTNAIFVYSTSTQYLIQTNVSLTGSYTTNFTVASNVNNVVSSATIYVPAGMLVTFNTDLNFVNGINATVTNSCTLILYTRP